MLITNDNLQSRPENLVFNLSCPWFKGVMKRAACCQLRKRQPSTSTVDVDQLKNAACLFQLVDVDRQHQPNKKIVLSTSTRLLFSSRSTVDTRRRSSTCRRLSTSILQPFSLRPDSSVEWELVTNFWIFINWPFEQGTRAKFGNLKVLTNFTKIYRWRSQIVILLESRAKWQK